MHTFENFGADYILELLIGQGYSEIEVIKLALSIFQFRFLSQEILVSMEWSSLEMWVRSHRQTTLSDLTIPRLAWISISGLPSLAFRDDILEKALGSEGKLLSRGVSCVKFNQLVCPKICISTTSCEEIRLIRKVQIGEAIFEVLLKEDVSVIMPPREILSNQGETIVEDLEKFSDSEGGLMSGNTSNLDCDSPVPESSGALRSLSKEGFSEPVINPDILVGARREERQQDWNLTDNEEGDPDHEGSTFQHWGMRMTTPNHQRIVHLI